MRTNNFLLFSQFFSQHFFTILQQFYNPKILRKFLNNVDGLTEGVGGGGVGSSVGVS